MSIGPGRRAGRIIIGLGGAFATCAAWPSSRWAATSRDEPSYSGGEFLEAIKAAYAEHTPVKPKPLRRVQFDTLAKRVPMIPRGLAVVTRRDWHPLPRCSC